MKLIRTEEAVGHVLCHDLTQIIRDQYKDARFRKGHVVTEADIPVLLSMGKEHLYVWEMTPGMLHENDAAERLYALCANTNMDRSEVKEGKIELKAACDGLFRVNSERLIAVNTVEDIMIATRKGGTAVRKGDKLAGMRVIPLIIPEEKLQAAEQAAGDAPLLELRPWVRKTAAIVATGSEVKKGLIQDTFTPVVKDKLAAYGIETISVAYSGDGVENVASAVTEARSTGADVILCTGGREVDAASLEEAAGLAAWYSQAKSSANVPVDCTAVKNVKKPAGSRPGMVTYTNFRTLYVTPEEDLVRRLRT